MKHALQFLIAASIAVSLAAMAGFIWNFLGYALSGAFGSVLRTPEDPTAKGQLFLWGGCSVVAIALTFWLIVVYHQQFKRKLQ